MIATQQTIFTDAAQLSGTLVSVSSPCPELPLVDFLRRAHGERRIYWENAREQVAFAGYGVAAELIVHDAPTRFDTLQALAERLWQTAIFEGEAPRLFGGFAFADEFQSTEVWEGMAAAHFVVPAVMLTRHAEHYTFTLSAYVPADSNPLDIRQRLTARLDTLIDDLFWNYAGEAWNPAWEEASSIEYPMSAEDWAQMLTTATEKLKRGELDKVVLARMAQIRFSSPVNIVRALEFLHSSYPDCHRFLFEPHPHHAFYGATPETLVKRDGHHLLVDALAGTIKRGATPEADAALGDQLLNDPKERQEHAFVVDVLREQLRGWLRNIDAPDTPTLLKLSNVQHLHTPMQGELRSDVGIIKLIKAFHPTPALGGKPRQLATDLIRQLEPITRGWYAAPIGWIDPQMNGHFGVAIRSAISREGTVWCYAGAGIVAESVPEHEWQETNLKFRPMLNALGIRS